MGNAPSSEEVEDIKQESTVVGIVTGYVILGAVILAIIVVVFKYGYQNNEGIKLGIKSVSGISSSSIDWGKVTTILTPVMLVGLMLYYFGMAINYNVTRGKYRSRPESINELLSIRRGLLSNQIDPLIRLTNSVCRSLTLSPRTAPYNLIRNQDEGTGDQRSLVNWRPLTVRLTGYLGGINGSLDGVFDMATGVRHSLNLGARSFFFDIDYLIARPCEPIVAFRDDMGVMRSLHTGSIKDGMQALADYAFNENYDPVLIIIYLRRLPKGKNQKALFFKNIAVALDPLAENHLGQTAKGNFHNCNSESQVFTSPIINYQKKFIVITNYNTTILPRTPNPKDNLNYWTNARIYQDPSGISAALGSVTASAPTAPAAVSLVGSSKQLLIIGEKDKPAYLTSSISLFKIALASPDYDYTVAELNILLNVLGVQCVPLDVLRYGVLREHSRTLDNKVNPVLATATRLPKTLAELSSATNLKDPLSFWTYGGWSWKNLTEGFANYEGFEEKAPVKPIAPIPGFVIPRPQVPKKPSSTLNSNGGLVNVA